MTRSPKRARPREGQAKVLTAQQIKAIAAYLRDHHRHVQCDRVMFLLSVEAGLQGEHQKPWEVGSLSG
jgi:hypothetical protein